MEAARPKQGAAQRTYKKHVQKKDWLRTEVQPSIQVYSVRPPQKVQRLGSGATDPLTGHKQNLEEATTKGSHKLLPLTMNPYKVESAMKSTVTIDKTSDAILVSSDRLMKMPRVPDDAEPLASLDNTMAQAD